MNRRFPPLLDLLAVYSVVAFLLYGWTLVAFIWKLPSWLNYLTVDEIIIILAYSLTAALTESILITGFILLLSSILPPRFFLDDFVANGSLLAICVLSSAMIFLSRYVRVDTSVADIWPIWLAGTFTAFVVLLLGVRKVRLVRQGLLLLADQLTIFSYILVSLSVVSFIMVLYRNFV